MGVGNENHTAGDCWPAASRGLLSRRRQALVVCEGREEWAGRGAVSECCGVDRGVVQHVIGVVRVAKRLEAGGPGEFEGFVKAAGGLGAPGARMTHALVRMLLQGQPDRGGWS